MKFSNSISVRLISASIMTFALAGCGSLKGEADKPQTLNVVVQEEKNANVLTSNNSMTISVIGQGVSPENTISNAQAVAMAKRAAVADAYRQLAEKVGGVKVEGMDYVRNMVTQRSQIKTFVSSVIRHANIVETKCSNGFCEVEMELKVSGNKWVSELTAAYK